MRGERDPNGPVVLLDLNYTLVANSAELSRKGLDFRKANERYRGWLVDLIERMRPRAVVLLTIRQKADQEWTLANIARQLDGWQPDRAIFAWLNTSPERFKELALETLIMPEFGSDPAIYLPIESNQDTHRMYAQRGICGLKAFPSFEAG